MKIEYGNGTTEFGPGVEITLEANEVAQAISQYIANNQVIITGPSTVLINDELCTPALVYVDPSGAVDHLGVKTYSGRGPE